MQPTVWHARMHACLQYLPAHTSRSSAMVGLDMLRRDISQQGVPSLSMGGTYSGEGSMSMASRASRPPAPGQMGGHSVQAQLAGRMLVGGSASDANVGVQAQVQVG